MKFLIVTVLVAIVGITVANPVESFAVDDLTSLDLYGILTCVPEAAGGSPSNLTKALEVLTKELTSKISIIDSGFSSVSNIPILSK